MARTLQVLSQLAWMMKPWFTRMSGWCAGWPEPAEKDFTEKDKPEFEGQATGITWDGPYRLIASGGSAWADRIEH